MAGVLGTHVVTQVAFIVKDVAKTKKKFAEFLGLPEPPTIDGGKYEVTKTVVEGKPAPDANCLMAFLDGGPQLQIELIQPNGHKSTWQDFLDQHGEGIHHIAFAVDKMDNAVASAEKWGLTCVQRGIYGDATGEYAYLDAYKDLHCVIELLENYKK